MRVPRLPPIRRNAMLARTVRRSNGMPTRRLQLLHGFRFAAGATNSGPGIRPRTGTMSASGFDRQDGLDLDRNLVRQRAHADRRAGMLAGIAEHFNKQIRAAIDDFRL